jgi:hypothetical protein
VLKGYVLKSDNMCSRDMLLKSGNMCLRVTICAQGTWVNNGLKSDG